MQLRARRRPTIGVLTGWQVYDRSVLLKYLDPLFHGICAAARDYDCDLLIAGGINFAPSLVERDPRPAWPELLPETDFVPVGPWNTDGIIAVNPLLPSCAGSLARLRAAGHPLVFIGTALGGPAIGTDNQGGIRQAIAHLAGHGHRRIAYIAGSIYDQQGDSGERLLAYKAALAEFGLEHDPGLVVNGEHTASVSEQAMRALLDSGQRFSAVLGSNDESAIGAIRALAKAGLRIPDDVAVVGFDDMEEASIQDPPLTSIRSPTFARGYQAVELMLQHLEGRHDRSTVLKTPTQLVARQSCGCLAQAALTARHMRRLQALDPAEPELLRHELAAIMSDAIMDQPQELGPALVRRICVVLVNAFASSLERSPEGEGLLPTLERCLRELEQSEQSAHCWQAAISVLSLALPALLQAARRPIEQRWAEELLAQGRVMISEHVQRQYAQYIIEQQTSADRVGLLSAGLLTSIEEHQAIQFLADHLPAVGIRHGVVAFFQPDDQDLVATSLIYGLPGHTEPLCMESRAFPPRQHFPEDRPLSLILLPLVNRQGALGYIALDTSKLRLCGAITQHLMTALQSIRLYKEIDEGRRVAEEASRLKSRFLSSVSHELRTPLSLISGLSEIVLRGARQLDHPALRDLERIHASAQHLDGLIRDVLDLAQSEVGQLRLSGEPINLAEALAITFSVGEQLAGDKGLGWRLELPAELPLVWGDRTRLRQILLNLISNAVKFTASGEIVVAIQNDGSSLTISVRDTGLGIPAEDQATIFEEFQRSERTSARGYGGLGLGLAICKRLVQLHGGSMQVSSSGIEGNGSVFYVKLPALQRGEGAGPPTTSSGQLSLLTQALEQGGFGESDRQRVILVVDDEPGLLDLHARAIEAHAPGYHALKARNGQEALALIRRDPPDLVLLDLQMPELDGYGVLQALREHEQTRGLPVVILTAQMLNEADMARLNRSVATVLDKGVFSIQEILNHIEQVLARNRKLGSETQRIIRKAIAYIHEHYAEPLSRDEIAAHLGVNKDYLTRCFSQELGISPVTFLNRYRVSQARLLLASGNGTITEIAQAVGFADSNYFSRVFRKETGISPRDYERGS